MPLQYKTTTIIYINNINNLYQQLARQSTPCRAQGISCKCQQVYKSKIQRDFKDNKTILAVGRSPHGWLCVVLWKY